MCKLSRQTVFWDEKTHTQKKTVTYEGRIFMVLNRIFDVGTGSLICHYYSIQWKDESHKNMSEYAAPRWQDCQAPFIIFMQAKCSTLYWKAYKRDTLEHKFISDELVAQIPYLSNWEYIMNGIERTSKKWKWTEGMLTRRMTADWLWVLKKIFSHKSKCKEVIKMKCTFK